MARTPQDSQVFLREVDEELRRDELERFWKRWGWWIAGAVVAALLAFGGWLVWQQRTEAAAGREGAQLQAAIDNLSANRAAAARPVLEGLTGSGHPGYRATARLALGDIALTEDRPADAARIYSEVATDQAIGVPFRDLALVRATAAEFDRLPPATVIQRLGRLAQPGNPWFGSAGEMVGLAHLRAGQGAEAQRLFQAIAGDASVPQSIRSRAVQFAGLEPSALAAPPAAPAAGSPPAPPAQEPAR